MAQADVYPRYEAPDFAGQEQEMLDFWQSNGIFQASVNNRQGAPAFTFYEGPPSANGTPGIHHVMARAIKDIFCRYKTQQGFQVHRKAGWDTHGLPIELQVEKTLGITKRDIGSGPEHKISVAEYNAKCREDVLKYKAEWDELTRRMGYWVNLEDPYITYERDYIESVWQLLKRLFEKGLLYKGYTIQPYSPAAGTGLSSHELNQPGCYRQVKDTSVTAMFRWVLTDAQRATVDYESYFLAWTTTPWTLPSNAALAVGPNITYADIETLNPYTATPCRVVLAEDAISRYFQPEGENGDLAAWQALDAKARNKTPLPWVLKGTCNGAELVGIRYEPVLGYVKPAGRAFETIAGDFVTTEDGTGIVHIAPTFGADDKRVADQAGIAAVTVPDANGDPMPLVDKTGKFVPQLSEPLLEDFGNVAGKTDPSYQKMAAFLQQDGGFYVKPEYTAQADDYPVLDIEIATLLKKTNRAFRVEKYNHSYPHCWRTDKPVLYYPLDSWFVRTSALKDRLVELNRHINWKPAGTGTGRFGNWLENLVDWNLSRSRYWGTPLPVWVNEARTETKCIGSVEELIREADQAVAAGLLTENPARNPSFDLHRPYVDEIILADTQGKPMYREPDLIDVWFDSGAMPFAQWHYPFENRELWQENFPADFIAEGVDQTRGWFFTLHAIAVMLEDTVAYRNVIANGLVLDKDGNKMSKRLGNAIDPFETIAHYGADSTRWYMVENAPPWENLRFNPEHLKETQRKFFGTLFYTYDFFALYANIDSFRYNPNQVVPPRQRQEMDRWIISALNTAVAEATAAFNDYDPTRATRAISHFVVEQLSNWYVRQSRRRFWKGEMSPEKQAAYETLYEVLFTVSKLIAPVAPFYAERLYRDLVQQGYAGETLPQSVHLTDWPVADAALQSEPLERRMEAAQRISSLAHGLRKKHKLKVRQPLQKIVVPVLNATQQEDIAAVAPLIRSEINVLEVQTEEGGNGIIKKRIKPNFRSLGPKLGKAMKQAVQPIQNLGTEALQTLEAGQPVTLTFGEENHRVELTREDVEVVVDEVPGYYTATDGKFTVALDVTLNEQLEQMGLTREYVNRIQNLRKEQGLEVTDRIALQLQVPENHQKALQIEDNRQYICTETLASTLVFKDHLPGATELVIEEAPVYILIEKDQ